jgi:hypothetical protein
VSARLIQARAPELLTETQFSGLVRELAAIGGWRLRYHTVDSRGSKRGFPDWVLVHREDRRIIFAELKTETGKPTEQQEEWLEALERVRGLEVHLWRPSDWAREGGIVQTLTGRRPA